MLTYGQLIATLRPLIWPTGESPKLVAAHNQSFIECLIDLQTWVDCLKQNHYNSFPHCSTLYDCGLTAFEAPRGNIKRLFVVDRLNADTGKEDSTAAIDWCSDITYREVDICYIRAYLSRNRTAGCCFPAALFFAISPYSCRKAAFPVPTDEGVPKGLPVLPLGFHYGQESTDSKQGRALAGVWAKDQGNIYVAPWIQSTETVIAQWEGIKRKWADADPIDDDPLLHQAMQEFARWKHYDKWEFDEATAARAKIAYEDARTMLISQCREETRVRSCEPSLARSSPGVLYYNDEQSATATCPDGQTGDAVTQVIPAGTVASNKSVADANALAKTQAIEQAKARLDCATTPVTYSSEPQTYTASCAQAAGAPVPDGNPVQVTVPAGAATSTVSQAEANAAALAIAKAQAENGLACTWWNAEQSYPASCPTGSTGSNVTKTKGAHIYSSTFSQDDADSQALNAAKVAAEDALVCTGSPTIYKNTEQVRSRVVTGCGAHGPIFGPNHSLISPADPGCEVSVIYIVAANTFSSTLSQANANQQAIDKAQFLADQKAGQKCVQKLCGDYTFNFP